MKFVSGRCFSDISLFSGLLFVILLGFGGCAGSVVVQQEIESLLGKNNYAEAYDLVEENRDTYGAKDEVLWLLDSGTLLYYQGRHSESIEAFHEAERRMDELFQLSLSEQAASLIANDKFVTYAGENFENVMVNVYKALSFAQLGNRESAQIESRKLNDKLNYINSKQGGVLNARYQEDAFARMLSGIFYEWGRRRSDTNDALIANRNSFNLYQGKFGKNFGVPAPSALKSNLLATAPILGRSQFNLWKKRFPNQEMLTLSQRQAMAGVYIVHFAGKAPVKEELRYPYYQAGLLLSLALSTYSTRDYPVHGSRIFVNGQPVATNELVHPTGNIAIKNFEDLEPLRISKALARHVLRNAAAGAVNQDIRAGISFLGNILLERADLRSWRTLPDKILLAQIWLPAGKHQLKAELLDANGKSVGEKELGELDLKAGDIRFLTFVTR